MSPEDGLAFCVDGPIESPGPEPEGKPEFPERPDGQRLWVVTTEHVPYALEACEFGGSEEQEPPNIAI